MSEETILPPKRKSNFLKDKASVFSIIGASLGLVIVIFLTFGVSVKFENLDSPAFWAKVLISSVLTLYSLFIAVPAGLSYYKTKENGRYDIAFGDFCTVRKEVIKRDSEFDQWLYSYYEKNRMDYLKQVLSLNGNIDIRVLDLDISEIDKLSHPFKKNWENTEFEGRPDTYFRSLTPDQIKVVKDIFAGKYAVERLPNDFFKAFNGKVVSSEYIEQARQNKKNKLYLFKKVGSKVISLLAFAFVFSSLIIEVGQASTISEIIERIITFLTRLFTMCSGYYYGFDTGKHMAMNEATSLEYKVRVNNLFLNDKDFKPLTNDELGKQELEREQFNKQLIGEQNE